MQTQQRASEPTESGWRGFFIPVRDGEEWRRIRFFIHRDPDGDQDDCQEREGDPGTHFLIDMTLSNLGEFRIDGLVKSNLVNLIIRTIDPLPDQMRSEIYELFERTLARTGLEGGLTFRAQPTMPPLPLSDLAERETNALGELHA